MPSNCSCAGATCGCKVQGSGSVEVAGTGTVQDPYIVSLGDLNIGSNFVVDDTTSVNLTLGGSGTELDPLVLSAVVTPGATVTSTPTNAGTTAIDSGTRVQLLNHSSTIASHTITLPTSTSALESEVIVIAEAAITALTVSGVAGVTVAGMPTTLAANAFFRARLFGTVWRRVG